MAEEKRKANSTNKDVGKATKNVKAESKKSGASTAKKSPSKMRNTKKTTTTAKKDKTVVKEEAKTNTSKLEIKEKEASNVNSNSLVLDKKEEVKTTEGKINKKGTIKLYEAIFFGAIILLLAFIVLYKFVTPNL
ncbi:MAG: hypothetical protein NC483_01855 [Ruminococcus sp.]|nr:hypothetical protein [Ruminococcus sp.]